METWQIVLIALGIIYLVVGIVHGVLISGMVLATSHSEAPWYKTTMVVGFIIMFFALGWPLMHIWERK